MQVCAFVYTGMLRFEAHVGDQSILFNQLQLIDYLSNVPGYAHVGTLASAQWQLCPVSAHTHIVGIRVFVRATSCFVRATSGFVSRSNCASSPHWRRESFSTQHGSFTLFCMCRWWRSFLCGGSTSFFVYGYCFYYYNHRSDMSGLMQTSFFFGYNLMICLALFLMLGTVGWRASLLFVRHIYRAIKCE